MTPFLLKCLRQAQGNNLCAYYVCENVHDLVGSLKTYTTWQLEGTKKLLSGFQLILLIDIINIFTFL